MEPLPTALVELIAAENAMAAAPSIIAVATAARRRHGPGIAAVLFYGSCLRRGDDVGASSICICWRTATTRSTVAR